MKGIFMVVLVFTAFGMQGRLGFGKSCVKNSHFVVTDFDVQPYPPTAGQVMAVVMSGAFNADEYVSDVDVRTSFNNGKYNSKYFDYAKACVPGQIYVFSVNITAGTQGGVYDVQVHLDKKQGDSISCWDFTYHI